MENPLWSYIYNRPKEGKERLSETLRKIPIFDNLGRYEIRWIEKIIHVRKYNRGELVFAEDEPGVGLYFVSKGGVRIFKKDTEGKEITLATLKEGQFFGELSLLDDSPRSASAIATEPSVLLGFFHPDLMALIDRQPKMGCNILLRLSQLLGERLRKTNELLQ